MGHIVWLIDQVIRADLAKGCGATSPDSLECGQRFKDHPTSGGEVAANLSQSFLSVMKLTRVGVSSFRMHEIRIKSYSISCSLEGQLTNDRVE